MNIGCLSAEHGKNDSPVKMSQKSLFIKEPRTGAITSAITLSPRCHQAVTKICLGTGCESSLHLIAQ